MPNEFQVFVGIPEKWEKKEYAFNGIIYPILLFELKESKKKDIYSDFKLLLNEIKNKY